MPPSTANPTRVPSPGNDHGRLDYIDATRAFALVLGIVFHAGLSFMPVYIGWAVQDISTSPVVAIFTTVSHTFRMETFFMIAGFLSHVTFHRKGAGEFVRSRLPRLVVPFVVGWFILHPLVVSGWILGAASLRGHVDVMAGLLGGFQSLSTLPNGLLSGSHLWFLYYLALITALILTIRQMVVAAGSWYERGIRCGDALVVWLAQSSISPLILAIPTAVALWFMRFWGMDTPDRSLVPHLPALVVYGSFFGLGWMLSRQPELISRITRLTPLRWILAGVGLTAILWLGDIEHDPGNPNYVAAHVGYAVGYSLTMWSLTFLVIGIFRKLAARPSPFIRYLADSSYWMYLVHLPIVVWLQVAVAELPWHWSFKLALISFTTVGLSLLSYDLFVRSTFLGGLLNGRRRERVMVPWLLERIGWRRIGKMWGSLEAGAQR
jgi:peptidoglycan/LPS O-acetylase OafA/YrhL